MSSFLNKVEARSDTISSLISALAQTVGNKRYLHDLEVLLDKLELTPHDEETIWYLIRDLKN